MSTPRVVQAFYQQIWNAGDLSAVPELVHADFVFRGSLGEESVGRTAFEEYVRFIRATLADYRCDILECVTEENQAFARMRFSGRHVARFRGYEPTGKLVHWEGAALFRFEGGAISRLWVLGDLMGLDSVLRANVA